MKLDIPFYSQRAEDVPEEHQNTACGVVALKMALDFARKQQKEDEPSIAALIEEGIAIGGYQQSTGWIHDALVLLAHNHGAPAYREEFRSVHADIKSKTFSESSHAERLVTYGIGKCQRLLKDGAVPLVSVSKFFSERDKFHLVALTGFGSEDGAEGFYYHDPHYKTSQEGAHRFVDIDTFRDHWRRFAIFVG